MTWSAAVSMEEVGSDSLQKALKGRHQWSEDLAINDASEERTSVASCSSSSSSNDLNSSTGHNAVKLIIVRDIGIQVCGDSPNLNLTRRMHPAAVASGTSTVAAPTAGGAGALLTRVPQPQASSGPRPSVSVGALPSAVEAAAAVAAATAASSTSHLASKKLFTK